MPRQRARTAFFVLRAAMTVVFLTVAVFAFAFAPPALGPVGLALSAELEDLPGTFGTADDLGLGIGPVYSNSGTLFSILYNASSYGEMRPCPT